MPAANHASFPYTRTIICLICGWPDVDCECFGLCAAYARFLPPTEDR